MRPSGLKRRVAILVANPFRDLPGHVLTASRLAQSGCDCYLIPFRPAVPELWALAPDLALFSNLRAPTHKLMAQAQRAGIKVAVLDTEGGVFSGFEWYDRELAHGPVMDAIACFCSWGPRLAEHMVENWLSARQVVVTGTPRMDFYSAGMREQTLRMSTYADEIRAPIVLINGNFSQVNRWGSQSRHARKEELETESVALAGMVKLVNRLAASLPEATFVYRPHPFEGAGFYQGLFLRLPNLRVIKRGSVEGWILRSSAVIQRGCSTAIESVLAGVPSLSPNWLPVLQTIGSIEAVSRQVASEEDMLEQVSAAVEGRLKVPEAIEANLAKVVADWFYRVDGQAHERVAVAMLNAMDSPGEVSRARCEDALDGLVGDHVTLRTRARVMARRLLRRPVGWSFRQRRQISLEQPSGSERSFTVEDVERIVSAIGNPCIGVGEATGDYRFPILNGSAVRVAAQERRNDGNRHQS